MNDTKHIGVNVHQATISVAVLDSSGKLVAARWASVLVCDPRKNALLKAGNKNDWIDARKLADLLRTLGCSLRSITERTASELCENEPPESDLQKLGYSLRGAARVRTTLIAPIGWASSPKARCGGGRRFTTNNWTRCGRLRQHVRR